MRSIQVAALAAICVALVVAIGVVVATSVTYTRKGRCGSQRGGARCGSVATCGSNGTCTAGRCVCKPGYGGPTCRELSCYQRRCANGTGCDCATGLCVCNPGYHNDPITGLCVAGAAPGLPCHTSADCVNVPGKNKCDAATHLCVAGQPPPPEQCRTNADCAHVAGKPVCNATTHKCEAVAPSQCHTNADCAHVAGKPVCDTTTHQCEAKQPAGRGNPTLSATDFMGALAQGAPAVKLSSAVDNFKALQTKAGAKAANLVLAQYASVEFAMSGWPAQRPLPAGLEPGDTFQPSGKISNTIDPWFRATIAKCGVGDVLLINGDFVSVGSNSQKLIAAAITRGLSFVFVLDRWEVAGNPIYASRNGTDTTCPSPQAFKNRGNTGGCKLTWPYPCATVGGTEYCGSSNGAITGIMRLITKDDARKRFFVLDEAAVSLPNNTSSRQSPWHNHRHATTFYMKSQNCASIFRGSWNFTSGDGSDGSGTLGPGQKEGGMILTTSLDSDLAQADLIQNYYWLAAMNTFAPMSAGPTTLFPGPAAFLAPGSDAAPLFQSMLDLVGTARQDKPNDLFKMPAYGATKYEMYSLVLDSLTGTKLMGACDPSVTISIGVSPPPAGIAGGKPVAAPSPTPWESGPSSMLARTVQDNTTSTKFSNLWPTLSCVSNTMQFLYPYAGIYRPPNKAPPVPFRVEKGKAAIGCPPPAAAPGQWGGSSGAAVTLLEPSPESPFQEIESIGAAVTLLEPLPESPFLEIESVGAAATDTCKPLPANGDLSAICLTAGPDFLPNSACYTDGGKSYECSAAVPWMPGALWLGGLLYKFYQNAAKAGDQRIYIAMYSDFADAPQSCLLECTNRDSIHTPGYPNTGGLSSAGFNPNVTPPGTPLGRPTSTQYSGKGQGIDGSGWFSNTDVNCAADVLEYLANNKVELYAMAGQWTLNADYSADPYYSAFYNAATKSSSTFQYKLYQAQTGQNVAPQPNGIVRSTAQRNHSKAYLSKTGFVFASGHPYNGSYDDFSGINEVVLAEDCPNVASALARNFENEFKYAETPGSLNKVNSSFQNAPTGFLNPGPITVAPLPAAAAWTTSTVGGGYGLVA